MAYDDEVICIVAFGNAKRVIIAYKTIILFSRIEVILILSFSHKPTLSYKLTRCQNRNYLPLQSLLLALLKLAFCLGLKVVAEEELLLFLVELQQEIDLVSPIEHYNFFEA